MLDARAEKAESVDRCGAGSVLGSTGTIVAWRREEESARLGLIVHNQPDELWTREVSPNSMYGKLEVQYITIKSAFSTA